MALSICKIVRFAVSVRPSEREWNGVVRVLSFPAREHNSFTRLASEVASLIGMQLPWHSQAREKPLIGGDHAGRSFLVWEGVSLHPFVACIYYNQNVFGPVGGRGQTGQNVHRYQIQRCTDGDLVSLP